MKYPMNEKLIKNAWEVLYKRRNIYWIVGGACAGKSTVCKAIGERYNIPVYDMDEHVFGKYQSRYTDNQHPASRAWFTATNPLEWALSFASWEENNQFNIAATAEQISLFCEDVKALDKNQAILVDGGITNPAVLAKVLPLEQQFCLKIEDDICDRIWEESKDRKPMREMIFQLPDPHEKWRKFLLTNRQMNQQIEAECKENNIRVFFRDEKTTVDEILKEVSTLFFNEWQKSQTKGIDT